MPPRLPFKRDLPSRDEHRINDRIRVPRVKVVDENGAMLGELPTLEALRMAKERGYDLVEVAADARPPVCKFLDYGKYKYEQKKKQKKSKSKQHVQVVKEVRMRPLTDDHDVATKVKKAREILEHGDKILITIFFRGREQAHKEIGRALMDKIKKGLDDVGKLEHDITMQGPRMQITMLPKPGMKIKPKPSHAESEAEPAEKAEAPSAEAKPEGSTEPVKTAPPAASTGPNGPEAAAPAPAPTPQGDVNAKP